MRQLVLLSIAGALLLPGCNNVGKGLATLAKGTALGQNIERQKTRKAEQERREKEFATFLAAYQLAAQEGNAEACEQIHAEYESRQRHYELMDRLDEIQADQEQMRFHQNQMAQQQWMHRQQQTFYQQQRLMNQQMQQSQGR